jgi:hypothetical protein
MSGRGGGFGFAAMVGFLPPGRLWWAVRVNCSYGVEQLMELGVGGWMVRGLLSVVRGGCGPVAVDPSLINIMQMLAGGWKKTSSRSTL